MTMQGFIDDRRAVLRVSGGDARGLLQDLVTNNLDQLSDDTLIYSALLTPQGKYLFDFFFAAEGDALLIDVAADRAAALAQRLSMYKLRRDMVIEGTEMKVALHWGDGTPPPGARPDPRHPALGVRLYADNPEASGGDPAAYDALRVALTIPDTGAELIADQTYILEAGFERLHGVDFRKGCYVGQEVTARMKHKTTLKKGLAVVSVTGPAAPGDALTTGGKPAGTLHTVAGDRALAHLRFDRAEGEMETSSGGMARRVE